MSACQFDVFLVLYSVFVPSEVMGFFLVSLEHSPRGFLFFWPYLPS